jgi:hypothetical protein
MAADRTTAHDGPPTADHLGVMATGGFYDRHSATQGAAADEGIGLLEQAARTLDLPDADQEAHPITVADLGCAQGHNSLPPLRAAVAALRARTAAPIRVVHTDLPGNDWATLFDVIEHDPGSYLVGAGEVYPGVIGRSFYRRLFAPGTLALAWSSSALHWLSRSPGPIADHFFVQSSTDEAATRAYRDRSAADWSAFLEHRAAELVPGGSVVLVDVLMGDDHSMGAEPLFDCLEQALRAARDRGDLTGDEYAAIAYPTWFRTLDELRAPFAPDFTAAGGQVLALDAMRRATLADPFRSDLAAGASDAYGRAQAGFLAGFLRSSFRTELAVRPDRDPVVLLDAIFADAATRIADAARADPERISPEYRLVVGRLRRRS